MAARGLGQGQLTMQLIGHSNVDHTVAGQQCLSSHGHALPQANQFLLRKAPRMQRRARCHSAELQPRELDLQHEETQHAKPRPLWARQPFDATNTVTRRTLAIGVLWQAPKHGKPLCECETSMLSWLQEAAPVVLVPGAAELRRRRSATTPRLPMLSAHSWRLSAPA